MSDFVLDDSNYYSVEANKRYCSASQFKDFIGCPFIPGCEERALATIEGKFVRETTPALLIGSFLDALWENDDIDYLLERFPDCVSSRGKTKDELKSDYKKAMKMYQVGRKSKTFSFYMSGDKQTIMTGEIEGLPYKIKIDSFLEGKAIVDLKTTQTLDRDFTIFVPDSGERLRFYRGYGYDIQLAIYQEIVRQKTGDKLKCYLACVDKDDHPMCDIIQLTQKMLDEALDRVKRESFKISQLKSGEIQPIKCNLPSCDYCRDTHECEVLSVEEFEQHETGEKDGK